MEANERFGSDAHHGGYGELHVSDLRTVNRLSEVFVEAGQEAQYSHNADFNGDTQDGNGFYQVTQREVRRCSYGRASLSGATGRPKPRVVSGVRETRIVRDERKASGGTYESGGKLTDLSNRGKAKW